MPEWRNGRRTRLKIERSNVCGFKSHLRHMKINEELKKLAKRTDIWREGEYLDLWSLPHFLSGALLACFVYLLHLSFFYAIVLAIVLLIAYEIFEVKVGIYETAWNRILDVVVGLISFIPVTLIIHDWVFVNVFILGLCVGIPNAVLSFLGWSASQKGLQLELKIKNEYEFLKDKFLKKMKARAEKKKEKIAAKLALKQLKKIMATRENKDSI